MAGTEVYLHECISNANSDRKTGRHECIAPADFFTQFGNVTNVRVSRNKKTGKAKHYAFLEFQYPEVAATAAEAMNDYMLFTQKLVVKMVSEKVYWLHRVDLSASFKHPTPDIPSSPRHQRGYNNKCNPCVSHPHAHLPIVMYLFLSSWNVNRQICR